jgi:hypothetical protein
MKPSARLRRPVATLTFLLQDRQDILIKGDRIACGVHGGHGGKSDNGAHDQVHPPYRTRHALALQLEVFPYSTPKERRDVCAFLLAKSAEDQTAGDPLQFVRKYCERGCIQVAYCPIDCIRPN